MLRYRDAFLPLVPMSRLSPPKRIPSAFPAEQAQPARAGISTTSKRRKPWRPRLGAVCDGLAGKAQGSVCRSWLTLLALFIAVVAISATLASAQSGSAPKLSGLDVVVKWAPLLLWGFFFNVLISVAAMAIGTVAGVPVGIAQIAQFAPLRWTARAATQLFRNSPWLVLLFLCMFLIPFEIRLFGWRIPFPDWAKAVMGFALPVMANTSEIVRGAIASVPTGQWDGAGALGLSRRQTLLLVILPQCIKRMLPPWMNLYSLIAMSTVNASIVGVSEMVTLTSQAHAAEGSRPELLAPLYAFVLVCFYVYCYPIGKWTVALERRHNVGG